jgi:hypothetical protein
MLASLMVPVMNVALVAGVAVVMPLSLEDLNFRRWLLAAASVGFSLLFEPGPLAAIFVAPWVALTVVAGVGALKDRDGWLALVAGFAGTAALALVCSRFGWAPFGVQEPIVKLTALHFTYAGAGTLSLARRVHLLRPGRWSWLARTLVFVAPPLVASGFVWRSAVGQLGGAVVMTLGVWLVALLQVPDAVDGSARLFWRVSCASPFVAMVLAVTWAANQYFPSVPALTVPDMVPTHGALNAFGFVLCAHLAVWTEFAPRER